VIFVEREPTAEGPYFERCCFCRAHTSFWTLLPDGYKVTSESVACCEACAARAHGVDLPTKEQWCRRERIADHRFNAAPVPPPKTTRKRKS
jgi:hypothetical protein